MHRTSFVATVATAATLAALALVGSGGASPSGGPLVITAVDNAYRLSTATVDGTVVTVHYRNAGKQLHEFAFGRVNAGHTLADVLSAYSKGKEVAWLHDLGGPGPVTPGANITVTRILQPGTYLVFDGTPSPSGVPHWKLGMARTFTVTGRTATALPRADAVITAQAKRFVVPALRGGRQTIELRNRSGAGRGFMLASLNPGKSEADVNRWTKQIESTGKLPTGPLPMTLLGAMQTIPSGTSVYVTLTLQAGRTYHLSDDESGIAADFTPR